MIQIVADHIRSLSIGSNFLGSGGGEESFFTQRLLECRLVDCSIQTVSLLDLGNDDLVALMVFLGSGIVLAEKNYGLARFMELFQKIEDVYEKKIDVVAALSIGGGSVFAPAFVASHLNIPLLDADCFGRTLPLLQMMSTNFVSMFPQKAFITNEKGDMLTVECDSFQDLERHARQITMSSGGLCLIVPQVLTGEEAKRGMIAGSLTRVFTIGQLIQDTHDLGVEEACGIITEYTKGKFIGVGGVVHSSGLNLPHPFRRHIVIKNAQEDRTWEIWMENEFNLLFENGALIAEVPDIITLCDVWTREPLPLNQLLLNENVVILTTPASDIWYTESGLALVRTQDHQAGKVALCGPSLSALKKTA